MFWAFFSESPRRNAQKIVQEKDIQQPGWPTGGSAAETKGRSSMAHDVP